MAREPSFTILKTGHVELRVTDLERARAFYVDVLGFFETERDADRLYLRGIEEWEHHSLVLRRGATPGLGHFAFRVAADEDLLALEQLAHERGLPVRWIEEGVERGQGRALRIQDPLGFPVEFYHRVERVERLLQQYHRHRGTHVLRIDHVNVHTPAIDQGIDWYRTLGFAVSEVTITEDDPPRVWAIWLRRKQTVHDVALMTGPGPRLHHIGFWLGEASAVTRAADVIAAAGYERCIERGPGRHGISNAMFLYLRDPDGNRIELYAGDYLIPDPDFEPVVWMLNDPRRQTLWGHVPPRSWFDEAAPVEDFTGTGFVAVVPPSEAFLPAYVDR